MTPQPHIQVRFETTADEVAESDLIEATTKVLQQHDQGVATISIAVIDDDEMHELNRRFLDHDYPTDVLSFRLSDVNEPLDGEIVVSIDTARTQAADHQWPVSAELMLYVVHGTLHLLGYDDHQEDERRTMYQTQRRILAELGHPMNDDDELSIQGGSS